MSEKAALMLLRVSEYKYEIQYDGEMLHPLANKYFCSFKIDKKAIGIDHFA